MSAIIARMRFCRAAHPPPDRGVQLRALPRGIISLAVLLVAGAASGAWADAPRLRPILGEPRSTLVEREDTLLDVAYRERLGFSSVARLNADLDEWIPVPGSVVRLPTRFVLPDVEEKGLLVNVPEMRLYDFRVKPVPEVYAAAIGDAEDPTPIGAFEIGAKRSDPVWFVPASIRAEKPDLPKEVPPGPENPLGSRWMTLGTSSYGIHGTNIRWSIGRIATHGCIRLYEDEMERLYGRTSPGTLVRIVYQPFKWGRDRDGVYLEAHPDVYHLQTDRLAAALAAPTTLGILDAIDLEAVRRTVDEARGVPVRVGTLPE